MSSTADAIAPVRRAGERHTTVLFAEAGPAGRHCLEALGNAAELSGGRVLHRRDTGVLALFSSPDAAAAAAARMQAYVQTLTPAAEPVHLRIGFHAGPVGQRDQDIFGNTVNYAIQVSEQAKDGQILTSHETAASLSAAIQDRVRPAPRRMGECLLGELVWRDALREICAAGGTSLRARAALQVIYRGKTLVRRRQSDSVSIGRDPECDLVVDGAKASRRHCVLFNRSGALLLRDESSNGTYVTLSGQEEVRVQGRDFPAGRAGSIVLGQPSAALAERISYQYG
jgi:hypothetical protein